MSKFGAKARSRVVFIFLALLPASSLFASNSLFFLEVQEVAGYSFLSRKPIYYSMGLLETMQKPSLGFDFIHRFSGKTGDIATLSLQTRLAWNRNWEDSLSGQPAGGMMGGGEVGAQIELKTLEFQIYNAFLKFKTRPFDIWVGHDRPAFGLASVFDNHALTLNSLVMMGFGFDRDWGFGIEKDTPGGRYALSLTAGSGMPLELKGNYFLSGRYAFGVLNEDNFSVGLSFGHGSLLDFVGYSRLSERLIAFTMGAADVTWLWNNLENRLEVMAGTRDGRETLAGAWRIGLGLLDENKLKIEFQPLAIITSEGNEWEFSGCLTYLAHPDWTVRAQVSRRPADKDTRIALQVYFYKGINF